MVYITQTKIYNTGYLPDDDESRRKQGLMYQNLSSVCFNDSLSNFSNKISCKNCYNYNTYDGNAYQLAKKSTQYKLIPPKINVNSLYPIHNDPVNYGIPPVNNSCICTRYLQAP